MLGIGVEVVRTGCPFCVLNLEDSFKGINEASLWHRGQPRFSSEPPRVFVCSIHESSLRWLFICHIAINPNETL